LPGIGILLQVASRGPFVPQSLLAKRAAVSLLFQVVFATCRSTHHRLALDSLRHVRGGDAEEWGDLFLHYHGEYLRGSKAPDEQFKDFRNHVLHVGENFWGGAVGEATRWYGRTVDSLQRKEWPDAVYSAGVLSHYFSDPFMPLHTAQSEQETQVHRALEWSVAKSYGELQQIIEFDLGGYPRVETPRVDGAPASDWLGRMILAGAQAANEHYQAVIDHYDLARGAKNPLAGMDGECKSRIARCLSLAVVGFARVLELAFAEAEVEPPPVEHTLQGFFAALTAPISVIANQFRDLSERMTIEAIYDEVQRTGKVVKNLPEDDREIRRLHAEEVLRIPLYQLDQQPAKPAGLQFGQGLSDSQHRNRLITAVIAREDLSRPLALTYGKGVAPRQAGGVAFTASNESSGRRTVPRTEPARSTPYPVLSLPAATTPAARRESMTTGSPQVADAPRSTVAGSPVKFRLSPGHPVVDAPTIGSKTAGRLEKAGVVTVGDLLAADAEDLAQRLNQKHITADVVRTWQQESSLNCRVPGLYNHDAQILVASGVTEPAELAAFSPEELLELVTPWVKSEDGQRVLRQQQPPDLAEVAQWIEWARSPRHLKAA
jgi:hypothetical protein